MCGGQADPRPGATVQRSSAAGFSAEQSRQQASPRCCHWGHLEVLQEPRECDQVWLSVRPSVCPLVPLVFPELWLWSWLIWNWWGGMAYVAPSKLDKHLNWGLVPKRINSNELTGVPFFAETLVKDRSPDDANSANRHSPHNIVLGWLGSTPPCGGWSDWGVVGCGWFEGGWRKGRGGGVIFTTCSRVTFPIRLQLSYASFPAYCRTEVITCVKNDVFAAAPAALIFDKKALCSERSVPAYPAVTKWWFLDFCLCGGLFLLSCVGLVLGQVDVALHVGLRPSPGEL